MPSLKESLAEPSLPLSNACPGSVDDADRAKSLINFLMQDKFFLAHYRSPDPRVRAEAMDRLNEAHHRAYGDGPVKND